MWTILNIKYFLFIGAISLISYGPGSISRIAECCVFWRRDPKIGNAIPKSPSEIAVIQVSRGKKEESGLINGMICLRRQISVDVHYWTQERKMNRVGRAGTDTTGGAEPGFITAQRL